MGGDKGYRSGRDGEGGKGLEEGEMGRDGSGKGRQDRWGKRGRG